MKQTALQQLIAWGDEKLKNEPLKLLSFAEVIDKAEELLEVEREQIEDAYTMGSYDMADKKFNPSQYYQVTYETNN